MRQAEAIVKALAVAGHEVRRVYELMAEAPRRFPPPWRSEKMPGRYVVRDANGQAMSYENNAEVLTNDEARPVGGGRPCASSRAIPITSDDLLDGTSYLADQIHANHPRHQSESLVAISRCAHPRQPFLAAKAQKEGR
jgi:hypothetical protein